MKFLDFIFSFLGQSLWNWLKFESIKLYARVSEVLRGIFISVTLIFLFIIIAVSGFVFIHIALFFILPWSVQTKAITLLVLGIFYFMLPTTCVLILYSRKQWARATGLENYAQRISSSKK